MASPILGGGGAKEYLHRGHEMSEAFEEFAIVALDSRGDGVAADGVVVPAALPGERTRVRLQGRHAELVEVLTPSPERAQPFCPWFGRCGGCATQHMSDGLYRNWKRGLVIDALKRATVAAKVGPLIDAHGAGRRRAVFQPAFRMAPRTRSASCACARRDCRHRRLPLVRSSDGGSG